MDRAPPTPDEPSTRPSLQLSGEGGLLAQLTKRFIESALEGELTDHLGRGPHQRATHAGGGNSRNGHRSKIVLTESGPVEITVPCDRDGSFERRLVAKRQRRLSGVDEMVISLFAKGLTTGDIQAHLPRSMAPMSHGRRSPRSPTGWSRA